MYKHNKCEQVLKAQYTCSRCSEQRANTDLNGIDLQEIHMGEADEFRTDNLYCKNLLSCNSREAIKALELAAITIDSVLDVPGADAYFIQMKSNGLTFIVDFAKITAKSIDILLWVARFIDRDESFTLVQGKMSTLQLD